MLNKRLFISGLIVNSLAACSSSPMELPQPKGDWVDFVPATVQPGSSAAAENMKLDTPKVIPSSVNVKASLHDKELPNIAADKNQLITGNAKNIPLYKAVRTLVPSSWNVKLSPDVAERFKGTISWTGGDQWKFVLSKSLNAVGLTPVVDDQHKEVTVKFTVPAAPKTGIGASPIPGKATATTSLTGAAPVAPKTAVGTSPLPGKAVITTGLTGTEPTKKETSNNVLATPIIPMATAAPKPLVAKKPAVIMPALKSWTISKGTTLKAAYISWAAKEKCIAQNREWIIQWDTDTNYPIDYPLSFSAASFEDATVQLFNLYRKAEAPLYVNGFRNQCLIVISDKK